MRFLLQCHTKAYINNLNAAMEKLADAEERGDVTAIVQLQAAIKFNGGGHLNHSIFWKARERSDEGQRDTRRETGRDRQRKRERERNRHAKHQAFAGTPIHLGSL